MYMVSHYRPNPTPTCPEEVGHGVDMLSTQWVVLWDSGDMVVTEVIVMVVKTMIWHGGGKQAKNWSKPLVVSIPTF